MVTVGIDLSTDPKKTALARLRWGDGWATVESLTSDWGTPAMAEEIEEADWAAIDAPFGWPDQFISTIQEWSRAGQWSAIERDRLRYRLTDERIKKTKNPLSVSSDRIASTAMRCAELLHRIAVERQLRRPVDRAGSDGIVECYPAAALKKWGFETKDYKGTQPKHRATREALVARIAPEHGWLKLDPAGREQCIATDHFLDAVICALVARAAALSLLDEPLPTGAELDRVKREGWIYLPAADSLPKLAKSAR